ncbi:MAG: hypothetical protein IKO61_12245 [Lachnospiraceae bacterium]|nr:hypothetical protein [Lachnospiraceae bacterium]
MSFHGEVITTLYVEGTALALVIGLMVNTAGTRRKDGVRDKIFKLLIIHALFLSVTDALSFGFRYQSFDGATIITRVSRNLNEVLVLGFLFHWMIFVDYLLYGSRDHLERKYRPTTIPIIVCVVALFVNTFTNFLFEFDDNQIFIAKPAYWVIVAIEYLYMLDTVVLLLKFYAKSSGPRFIRVLPFIVPFVAGSVISRLSPYEVRSLGMAVGLVLLHFSLMNERCYRDEETGFYNVAFLKYIAGFAAEHDSEGGCSIIFDGAEKEEELGAIIRDELPGKCAVVNMGHGRFMVLAQTQSKTAINLFINAVKEAAHEENMEISADYSIRDASNSGETFIKGIIEKI